MLTPEELEIESLHLNMHDNPEVTKALYSYIAEFLNGMISELVDNGVLEMQSEDVINALIEYRDGLAQISAL